MKKFSKVLAFLLCLFLVVSSFAACGRTVEKSENEDEYAEKSDSDSSDASSKDEEDDTAASDDEDAVNIGSQDATNQGNAAEDEDNAPSATPEAAIEATPKATPEATPEPSEASPSQNTDETTSDVEADAVLGVFSGSTYTNEFFNFSMAFPKDWTIIARDELMQVYQLGTEFIKEGSSNAKVVDMAMAQVVPLFLVSRHPLAYTGGTNGNINAVAENISLAKNLVKGPADYITFAASFMKAQGIESTMGETVELTIGGRDFAKVDVTMVTNGVSVDQTMYVTLSGDHAIVFTLTYFSEDEKKQLEKIVNTIDFD